MTIEVPMLRGAVAFSHRLVAAAKAHGEHRSRAFRRANWSWRNAAAFYEAEANLFLADPDAYLAQAAGPPSVLEDVFPRRVPNKVVVRTIVKVVAHSLFALFGALKRRRITNGDWTYRKAYVDDIELAFDADEGVVWRAVYPFPISLGRQWRYLRYLRRNGLRYFLDGNRYGLGDTLGFLRRRNYESLARLEARSELRRAIRIAARPPSLVQLSDEFNIGSLHFARYLSRKNILTHNVAHGVGKYFPVHAYAKFDTLIDRQEAYYTASVPCEYGRHTINAAFDTAPDVSKSGPEKAVVIVSQDFGNELTFIAQSERQLVTELRRLAADEPDIALMFKPHPNYRNPKAPDGFAMVQSINEIQSLPDPILLSLYSTTHIDPRFQGRKFLIRTETIRPEILYDDPDRIIDVDKISTVIRSEYQ
ncbi:hypothetical protein [Parerythrobacter jejuensis]|uniref:Uncharacterized protein n=1 Tax=Parerythrobacter jejuensis TaxID=795812 RepID=A0A845ANY0_9SPHN|nr:hypothetical protein [Parerythrobacter jejuensis]MXP30883.1 hypothetical protein [Parerythrobacter jejuensis]MXP33643.1 hypothetical protein [Parerythrobacter jejuensis]